MRLPRTILMIAACAALGTAFAVAQGDESPRSAETDQPVKPVEATAALTSPGSAGTDRPAAFIETFLKANCLECHGEKVQKGDLALHIYKDEKSILKDHEVWEDVLEQVRKGEMPPKKKPRPPAADLEKFTKAVDGIFEQAMRGRKSDPGHVTIRRLNRAEYNNTIRDLIGVDFQPADDFPSDDVGHGFDNIGDVLSLSPVLMERYLAAAENITQRAITPEPPKAPNRRRAGQNLEPVLRGPGADKVRVRELKAKGTLGITFDLTDDGEYVLRSRVYAQRPDDEPARISLLVDGNEAKTFEVTATQQSPMDVEAKLTLQPGKHKFAVSFLNPTEVDAKKDEKKDSKADPKDEAKTEKKDDKADAKDAKADVKAETGGMRTLFVQFIALEGPADTRPLTHRRLLACDPSLTHRGQTQQVLKRFMSRAYRRPATDEEVNKLVDLVEQVEAGGDKWETGIQVAFQAVLVSPKFLFRVELDDRPDSADAHPIDEYALASRLSYFLWSSMPDDELLDLAAKGQLSANLDAQVKRMLLDPRSKALVDNFATQWLQLRRLKALAPDTKVFPNFNERMRAAMLKETELFFSAIIHEDRSILELIDADFTFLNGRLARLYGIADTNGNKIDGEPTRPKGERIFGEDFVRVSLADHTYGGVLTQASVLSVTSNPTRTSPVKRGKFILDQILGTPPPPPPPNVPLLAEDAKAITSGSLRQRLQEHRANPSCANCHDQMDALGFAFENFNAIGGFRNKDGEFDIDPSGKLPDGSTFQGAGDLKRILKTSKKDLFTRCLTKKMLTYALGRGVEYYDTPTVDQIVNGLDQNGYKFSTLITEIVKSDPFRMRRGADQVKEAAQAENDDAAADVNVKAADAKNVKGAKATKENAGE